MLGEDWPNMQMNEAGVYNVFFLSFFLLLSNQARLASQSVSILISSSTEGPRTVLSGLFSYVLRSCMRHLS